MSTGAVPPLPPGYTLDSGSNSAPPLPSGYTLDAPAMASPGAPPAQPNISIAPPPSTATRVAQEGALGLASGLSGLAETPTPVISTIKGMGTPPSTGDIIGSSLFPGYGIAKGLYGAGKEAVAGIMHGDYPSAAHGAGSLAGQGLQLGLMKGENPETTIAKGTENVGKGLGVPTSPEAQALTKMKGAPDELQGTRNVEVAKKDLAQIAKTVPIEAKGANASFAHAKAMIDYAKNLWETEHQGPIARNINTPIDSQALVKVGKDVLTPEAIGSDPGNVGVAKRMNTWLDGTIGQPRSLGSADKLLREINSDLEANPQSAKPYNQLQIRVKQAIQQGLRDQINTTLESVGETGVSDVNKRYGALRDLADRAIQQGLAETRANTKAGPVPDWVHAYTFIHPTAHGLAESLGAGLNPGRMFGKSAGQSLSKGMKQLGASNLEAPPKGVIPPPPGPNPSTGVSPFAPPTGPPTGEPMSGPIPQMPQPPGFNPVAPPTPGNAMFGAVKQSPEARNLWGRPVESSTTSTTPGGMVPSNPASGLVKQEFGKIGVSDLVNPRQQTTLETMMRGPQWKDFDRSEKVEAVRDILGRK